MKYLNVADCNSLFQKNLLYIKSKIIILKIIFYLGEINA